MFTITPTHALVKAYSSHPSQNATSSGTHLSLPTHRLCAAAYQGRFYATPSTWLRLAAVISGCKYLTLKDIYNTYLLQRGKAETGERGFDTITDLDHDSTTQSVRLEL